MEKLCLTDEKCFPADELIKAALGDVDVVYKEFLTKIAELPSGVALEWKYYQDGKAWLCKGVYKKKTVFWLSVWEKYFKVVFYFTEKHIPALEKIDMEEGIKTNFRTSKRIGKLIPLVFIVNSSDQLMDLFKVISYKMTAK